MVRDGALMAVHYDANANRGVGARPGEGWKGRESGVNYGEEDDGEKENQYPKIVSLLDDSPDGGSIARKHQEAYAHMTKMARPLPPPRKSLGLESDSESEPPTARNPKRRRIEGRAASVASSNYRLISLSGDDSGGEEEAPGWSARKMKEPWQDVDADVPIRSFEEEVQFAEISKLKPGHPTLLQLLEDLRPKFPDDELDVDGDQLKCCECDGKLFKMPLRFNFERHLKSKVHLANRELRRAQGVSNLKKYPLPISARTSLGNFSIDAQERVPVTGHQGRSKLSDVGIQFFQMLQNEGHEKSIQMNLLDHRITASGNKKAEQIQAINEKIEYIEKKSAEEMQLLTESVKAIEEHTESEIKDAHVKIDGVDRRFDDRFLAAEEMILELKQSEKQSATKWLEMSTTVRESERKGGDFKEMMADKMANFSGKLAMFQQVNKETVDAMAGRLTKAEKAAEILERVKEVSQRLRYHKERVDEIEGKQRDAKKAVEALESQAEVVSDLELRVQMLTDQVKEYSTCEGQMTVVNERLQKESEHTRECLSALEIENEERQKLIETRAIERIESLETEMGERLAGLQQSYTSDMEGLLKVLEKQKGKFAAQQKLLASTNEEVQRQNHLLERYSKTLELQNQVIKVQNQRLAENDRIMKDHSRRLERQEEVSKHLRTTMPAFMTDIQMLNDKIEDHIDESREREVAREEEKRKVAVQAPRRALANPRVKMRRLPRRKPITLARGGGVKLRPLDASPEK